MPENAFEMGPGTVCCLAPIRVAPRSGLKLTPFKIVYGRPFQISVLGAPTLDLEYKSKVK